MRFEKLATTIDRQLDLLATRGMLIGDEPSARTWLETVGYYRLSAYWLPLERPAENGASRSKRFKVGVSLQDVTDLYVFDRKLRILVLEAIERIEVNVRSRWTYHMSHAHGAHAHLNHALFNGGLDLAEQLVRLARSVEKSEETFVLHYKRKYSYPYSPPLWSATELMTLGELSKWFQGTRDNRIKSQVARDVGLPTVEVAEGVLQVLSYVRNICAHHGRLWNRRTVKRLPLIKRFQHDLCLVNDRSGKWEVDNSTYNVLTVIITMMDFQNTDGTYRSRLMALLSERSDRDRAAMGFPIDWKARQIWSKHLSAE